MSQRLNYVHHARDSFRALDAVRIQVAKGKLPQRLLDLVYLRVSQINGCAYCIAVHSRDLLTAGLAVEALPLLQVWRETARCSPKRNARRWPGPKALPALPTRAFRRRTSTRRGRCSMRQIWPN